MISVNPFAEFRAECETTLRNVLETLFPEVLSLAKPISLGLVKPPRLEFGELSSTACFEIAKLTEKKPLAIAQRIVETVNLASLPLLKSVTAAGNGYVNFHVNFAEFAKITLQSALTLDRDYGFTSVEKPRKTIVEHTSVNPIHPIHIGQARNPLLGDALARILTGRGHTVYRHYYVDDVGRQTAVIAYGYEKLGRPKPEGKPDRFIGTVYAITSCIVEIQKLKKAIEKAKQHAKDEEETSKLQRELDDWIIVAAELETAHPQLFSQLFGSISRDENPEAQIADINLKYERGEKSAKRLIRTVSELCLEGFNQSLSRMGIYYDSWDWESDFVWNSAVSRVLTQLEKTPYVFRAGEVLEFEAEKVAQSLELKKTLGLREDYEIPSLTLMRADGTTLYTTRDIAYNLWKFEKAEQIINVIGMEQTLAQMQLKIAFFALGHADKAKNLRHFAYNLVRLPGYKMSSRTGRYVTLDETMDEAINRAYEEVEKRSPHLSEEDKKQISNVVGIGAIKYALVQVDPSKPVVFTWDRVLDFEKNSAPYIQYSHARAGSILRKAAKKPEQPDYALMKQPIERELVLTLAQFPDTFIDSAENLRPNEIADYANALADEFNTFYNALPVIKAEPQALSDARLALVEATKIVLRNALNLLGIGAPKKM